MGNIGKEYPLLWVFFLMGILILTNPFHWESFPEEKGYDPEMGRHVVGEYILLRKRELER